MASNDNGNRTDMLPEQSRTTKKFQVSLSAEPEPKLSEAETAQKALRAKLKIKILPSEQEEKKSQPSRLRKFVWHALDAICDDSACPPTVVQQVGMVLGCPTLVACIIYWYWLHPSH